MFKKLFYKLFNVRPTQEVNAAKSLDSQQSVLLKRSANAQVASRPKQVSHQQTSEQASVAVSTSVLDASALFYSLLFPSSSQDTGAMANDLERSVLAKIEQAFTAPQAIAEKVLKLPSRLSEVDRQIAQSDVDTKYLLLLIEQDPVLSIEVLKLCNSSAFKRSDKQITSLQQAVVQIGLSQLQLFVRTSLMKEMINIKPIYFRRFGAEIWRHSMQVAFLANELAEHDGDTAFFLGLLHDVGKIAIFKMMIEAFRQAEPGEQPSSVLFKQVMTTKSLGLSALLVKYWQLPAEFEVPLTQLANCHHKPTDSMALIIWRANIISECSMLKQVDKLTEQAQSQLLSQVAISHDEFELLHQKLITL
ncbi:HDOD domain-containing protein [Shewanella sp. WPAGA9]|uniref:HDOD domain-containing protein n=1 Tax=Shewanella sp. ENK2 TaxID=2775245 RepID=UPI00177D2EB1|nr:HDOD domain-containing protein [Shewanella sp. WPAGA9]